MLLRDKRGYKQTYKHGQQKQHLTSLTVSVAGALLSVRMRD